MEMHPDATIHVGEPSSRIYRETETFVWHNCLDRLMYRKIPAKLWGDFDYKKSQAAAHNRIFLAEMSIAEREAWLVEKLDKLKEPVNLYQYLRDIDVPLGLFNLSIGKLKHPKLRVKNRPKLA